MSEFKLPSDVMSVINQYRDESGYKNYMKNTNKLCRDTTLQTELKHIDIDHITQFKCAHDAAVHLRDTAAVPRIYDVRALTGVLYALSNRYTFQELCAPATVCISDSGVKLTGLITSMMADIGRLCVPCGGTNMTHEKLLGMIRTHLGDDCVQIIEDSGLGHNAVRLCLANAYMDYMDATGASTGNADVYFTVPWHTYSAELKPYVMRRMHAGLTQHAMEPLLALLMQQANDRTAIQDVVPTQIPARGPLGRYIMNAAGAGLQQNVPDLVPAPERTHNTKSKMCTIQ